MGLVIKSSKLAMESRRNEFEHSVGRGDIGYEFEYFGTSFSGYELNISSSAVPVIPGPRHLHGRNSG